MVDGGPAAGAVGRELARRADTVVELDTGHQPFLSQPAAVRDLLARP